MVRKGVGSEIVMNTHSFNCSNLPGPGLGGRTILDAESHVFKRAIFNPQMSYRFRKTLKRMRILSIVQISVAICSLAVLSAKDSELWGRCSDGAW